jgi:hypothetical protein
MRSAERRTLIVLGITAIIASIFSAMLATIWDGHANETSFIWNVPANSPIPHATYYPYYILEYWLIFWIVYATCEFVYFSADWDNSKWRGRFHLAANVAMGFYVIYISGFVSLVTLDVILVKDPNLQFDIYEWITGIIALVELEFILWVSHSRRGIIRGILREYRKRKFWKKLVSKENVRSKV